MAVHQNDSDRPDRLYFAQLLGGRDFARQDPLARQMVNFAYLIGDRATGEALIVDPAYAVGELLDVLRKHGYRFITLEDALVDPAYSLPNTYVGEEGSGWIEQWAITQGKIPRGAPQIPQWVFDRTNELHLSTGQVSADTAN